MRPGLARLRAVAALVWIVAYALASNVSLTIDAAQSFRRDPAPWPGVASDKLASLRAALPEHGVVGFLSAPARDGTVPTADWLGTGPDFFWTQFDVAPVVLARSGDADIVLVNAGDPEVSRALAVRSGCAVRRDLGGGLLVLERRRAP